METETFAEPQIELEVNIPLLRKVVEWAEAENAKGEKYSQWFQDWWFAVAAEEGREVECGTCYCIAGYVTALDGYTDPCTETGLDFINPETGDRANPQTYARDVLGLTDKQADGLFCADNTIEDIRRIAENLAGERL